MARNNNLSDFLSDIASAIRTKKGTSGDIAAQSFPEEILSIESGSSAINNINCVKYIDSYIDISEGYDFHGDGANPVTLPVNQFNRFNFPWINGQQYRISIVEAQTSGGGMVTVYAYNSSTNTYSAALVSAGYDAPNRSVEWTCNGVYDIITIYNSTGGGSACNWQHIKVEINVEGYYAVGTAQSTIPLNITSGYAKVKQLTDYATEGGTLYENSATYQVEPIWSFMPTTSDQFIRPAAGKEGWFSRETCIHIGALSSNTCIDMIGDWEGHLSQSKASTTATTGTEIDTKLFKITPKLTTTTPGYLSGDRSGPAVDYKVRDWAGTISASHSLEAATGTTGTAVNSQLFKVTPNTSVSTTTPGWFDGSGSGTGTATTYKVKDGSATTPTSSITATPSGPTWNSTTSKYDITFSGSKSITPIVSAGWVSAGTAGTVSASGTKSLNKSTSTVTGSVNVSATTTVAPGTVSINETTAAVSGKTQVNATPTTSTDGIGTYYLAVKATAAANSTGTTSNITGSGTAKSVTTAGYEPGSGSDGYTKAITISGTATAKTSAKDSSQYYIPLPSGTAATWVSIYTLSANGSVSPGTNTISKNTNTNVSTGTTTTTKPSTGYYVAVDASTAAESGTVSVSGSSSSYILGATAGWIPGNYTGNLGTANASAYDPDVAIDVSAKAASTTYIPITSGSATGVAGSLSGTTFTQDNTNKKKFNITTAVSAPAPSVGTGYIVSGAGSAGSSVNRTTSITITDAQAIAALGAALSPTYSSSAPSGGEQLVAYDPTGSADSYIYSSSGLYLSPNSYIKLNKPLQLTLPTSTSTSSSGTSKLTITPGTSNKYINIGTGYNSAAGYYTIQGSSSLVASNIKSGVSIFGVTGTYTGSGGSSSSIVRLTQAAYDNLATKDANTIYLIIG